MRHVAIVIGLGFILAGAAPAAAQDWYAGASLATHEIRFNPHYTFYDGAEPQQFDNRARGLQINLAAGRRTALGGRFSIGWQGAVGMNGFEWSLSIPSEPADIRYALPFTVLATAVPEVRLGSRICVFGEIGGGGGRVRETKTSPASSTYDYRAFRPVLAAGAGVRVAIGPRLDLLTQYQHLRYASFEFDTFTAAGARVEHVTDSPRSHSVLFGATTRF